MLEGLRVVELSVAHVAPAGRLLADMGAEVVVVEPPGGDPSRTSPPMVAGSDTSVFWEHYAASKRSVTADLGSEAGQALAGHLIRHADIVIEGEPPGRLEALGLGPDRWIRDVPSLVWASITTFGHDDPRSAEPFSDLTVLAEGGPVWSCGYDDHTLPPVRGLGYQGFQLGAMNAVMGILTAVIERTSSGRGQHVDVSLVAAAGVSTEMGSYSWLVAGTEVFRLTGRHAMTQVTTPALVETADGTWAHTGLGIRQPAAFAAVIDWLKELGRFEEFPDHVLLDLGADGDVLAPADPGADPVAMEIMRSGRDALIFLAEHLPGYDFFTGAQRRGLQCGLVLTPGQVLEDPQVRSRQWTVQVEQPRTGTSLTHPGPWYRSEISPWRVGPAPGPGQHQADVERERGGGPASPPGP